jgi:hypothetical protein
VLGYAKIRVPGEIHMDIAAVTVRLVHQLDCFDRRDVNGKPPQAERRGSILGAGATVSLNSPVMLEYKGKTEVFVPFVHDYSDGSYGGYFRGNELLPSIHRRE